MKKRSLLNKILILILLCLSIVSFGMFVACKSPKDPDEPEGPGAPPPEEPPEEIHTVIDDAYFCLSTGRFMASSVAGGDLIPTTFDLNEGEVLTFNGEQGVTIDSALINSLEKNVEHQIVIIKPDGKTVTYKAKVAERVIVRFADTDTYTNKEVYGTGVGTANDFMYIFEGVGAASGSKTGKSIFSCSAAFVNSTCATRWAKTTHSGLYVLANDINFTDEPSVKRHVSLGITDNSHNGHWNVDMDGDYLNSIEGKRESCYLIPRQGYGFIGTFDGRGKVIDTNRRNTSMGIFPPTYGATIKNLAVVNAHAYYWSSESPLVCSAKKTTFENIYVEYASFSPSSNTEGNKPMLTSFDECTLKNFIVYCDLLDVDQYLVFGNKINAGENSGYGQGRETTGVFSFVDFCDVNSAGTGVVNGHSYANAVAGDAFNGTTGVNVYAVGSTPLYINQEMDLHPTSGYAYKPTMRATYFVNQPFKYQSGSDLVLCDQSLFYEETVFSGTQYENTIDDLVEIVEQAKRQRYGVEVFTQLSKKNDLFSFRLINQEGFFDAYNKNEMKAQVLKNKNAGKTEFDAKYWNVGSDGTVVWKGLQ